MAASELQSRKELDSRELAAEKALNEFEEELIKGEDFFYRAFKKMLKLGSVSVMSFYIITQRRGFINLMTTIADKIAIFEKEIQQSEELKPRYDALVESTHDLMKKISRLLSENTLSKELLAKEFEESSSEEDSSSESSSKELLLNLATSDISSHFKTMVNSVDDRIKSNLSWTLAYETRVEPDIKDSISIIDTESNNVVIKIEIGDELASNPSNLSRDIGAIIAQYDTAITWPAQGVVRAYSLGCSSEKRKADELSEARSEESPLLNKTRSSSAFYQPLSSQNSTKEADRTCPCVIL
jgi:hypothetical protein